MELNEYQEKAMNTCLPESSNFAYMFLNFLGEVGEMTEKVAVHVDDAELKMVSDILSCYSHTAKNIRKGNDTSAARKYKTVLAKVSTMTDESKLELMKEYGDILWQLAGMHTVLGIKLEDTAWQNILKLADRAKRNKIDGDGDNR
ncbi:MAG: hypothetical protein KBT39_06770 [Bacteroidales bacterium]|nr:hypothetical protein [Bacteroidales bacterium]